MKNDPNATTLYMRWTSVLDDWICCNSTDKGAVAFERVVPKPKYFNVTLEVFDGQQYGITTLCVVGDDEASAKAAAVQAATDDGWGKVKVQFTRNGP